MSEPEVPQHLRDLARAYLENREAGRPDDPALNRELLDGVDAWLAEVDAAGDSA